MYNSLIIPLFCNNTDYTMDPKNSVIMRFQCNIKLCLAGSNNQHLLTNYIMATETTIKNRRYNELSIRLNSSLPLLIEQCNRLSKCDDVTVHPAELLARLEKVSSEADDIKIDVDDLKSSGDELVSVLEELDCLDTPKAREIKLTVESHCRGLINLLDTITGKRRQFQDDLLRYLAAEKEIKFWTEWIKEVEERFDKSKYVSLDIKKLTESSCYTTENCHGDDKFKKFQLNKLLSRAVWLEFWTRPRISTKDMPISHHRLLKSSST